MLESDDIIQYLFSTYGEPGEKVPDSLSNGFGNIIACGLSMAPRMGKGSKYEGDEQTQAKKPVKPVCVPLGVCFFVSVFVSMCLLYVSLCLSLVHTLTPSPPIHTYIHTHSWFYMGMRHLHS